MSGKKGYLELLNHPDPEVRWIAISDLEKMKGEEYTDLLIQALQDRYFESIRWRAAIAIGKRGDPAAVDALIAALGDGNYHVREEAVTALGMIGDERAVDPLIGMLQDPIRGIRLRVIRALAQIGTPAEAPLRRALNDPHLTFHAAVLDALREVDESSHRNRKKIVERGKK